jgi:hypothetical protein
VADLRGGTLPHGPDAGETWTLSLTDLLALAAA